MAHEKKTPKGWEIWSQPGQPTERFVTLVENESTARTLVEILSYQDEDALPEKTAYVEMVGELNLDDPEYAEYRVDADLVREAAAVLEAINGFGLTEARRNTNAVVWHGADTRITGDEIAAAGGYFWMTAYPKHGGASFETQGMTLEELVEVLLGKEEVIYVASDKESLKERVEELAE